MKIYYAIHDQSYDTGFGIYWTWFAKEELQIETLERFYSNIAVKYRPQKPQELKTADFWGGITRHENWTVIYRYYNGGYDSFNRPGRLVIFTAWIKTNETINKDLSLIFKSPVWDFIEKNSEKIPVPQVKTLAENIEDKLRVYSAKIPPEKISKTTEDDVCKILREFGNISAERTALIQFIQTSNKKECIMEIGEQPKRIIPVPKKEKSIADKIDEIIKQNKKIRKDLRIIKQRKTSNWSGFIGFGFGILFSLIVAIAVFMILKVL